MCYVRVYYARAGVFQGGTKKEKKNDHMAIVKIFTTTTWHQVPYQMMSPMRQKIKKNEPGMSRKHCMTKSASCHDDYPI